MYLMIFFIKFTLILGWAGLCLAEPGHGWQCGRPVVEVVFVLACRDMDMDRNTRYGILFSFN